VIEIGDVTISFGSGAHRIDAVRAVSFKVAQGEVFGLVGESGCGKSTLLRAIAGLQDTASGTIALAGQAVGPKRTRAERRLVQMVFQDPYGSLNPTHTVDRILSEPLAIQGLDNVDQRIERALGEVGMGSQHRFRYPHQISGGQRQRIAIARALIMEPKILLLDEPTSALDLSVQAEILNLLKRVGRNRGLTMLMVSHDLPVIAHMCSRIAVMKRGAIVETLQVDRLRRGEADHAYTRELLASSLETAMARAN
jgi:peptide/nickel transport system ATP-binding protein